MEGCSKKAVWILFGLFLLHLASSSRSRPFNTRISAGRCPELSFYKNLSTEMFQGNWYLAHQNFPKYSRCQNFSFNATSDRNMNINFSTKLSPVLENTNNGKAFIEDMNKPGIMTWELSQLQTYSRQVVTVVDTDYTNYAALVVCDDFGLLHVSDPIILLRTMAYGTHNVTLPFFQKAAEALAPYANTQDPVEPYTSCPIPSKGLKKINLEKTITSLFNVIQSLTSAFT